MRTLLLVVAVLAAPRAALAQADALTPASYPAGSAVKVVVETGAGPVDVEPSGDGTIDVAVSPAAAPGDDCDVRRRLDQAKRELRLSARARRAAGGMGVQPPCSAGFAVKLPPGVEATVASGSGRVTLGAWPGKAAVRSAP